MSNFWIILNFLAAFLIIVLASDRIAKEFQKRGLPLISGFLIVGVICGPYVLNIIEKETTQRIYFINDIALSFIAFAASSELYLKELRSQMNNIKWLALGQLVVTFLLISGLLLVVSEYIPYLEKLSFAVRIPVALLTASILCARSPASVIGVITEIRAKGPFSSQILGTTVLVDFSVIVLFAICLSIVSTLISGKQFSLLFLGVLLGEILTSVGLGLLLGLLLKVILSAPIKAIAKSILIVSAGYSAYLIYYQVAAVSLVFTGYEIHLEPLLICLIGSFYVVNYTAMRAEFLRIIHDVSPVIYIVFFTYAGTVLAIDIIPSVWQSTLIILVANLVALYIGTYLGGWVAGAERPMRRRYWTGFLTQAGVGLGLATIVAKNYPGWGDEFAAITISVIVLNQLIGPILFKRSLVSLGESRVRANVPEFDGVRDVIIIGFETQSVALARQISQHGWKCKIATRQPIDFDDYPDIDMVKIEGLTLQDLEAMDAKSAEAIVLMLTDEENKTACELIYEHIGTKDIVVRLNDRKNFDTFHKLGALIVDPRTAIVSLLDHFVRSPQATSLLLGMQEGQDTIDLEVLNKDVAGIYIRDLRLPADVIVLCVKRRGQMIISHGYTRLRLHDTLTLVGSEASLAKLIDMFDP